MSTGAVHRRTVCRVIREEVTYEETRSTISHNPSPFQTVMENQFRRSAAMTKKYRSIPNAEEPNKSGEEPVRCTVYFDDFGLNINVATMDEGEDRQIYTIRDDRIGYFNSSTANRFTVWNKLSVRQHNSPIYKLEFDYSIDAYELLYSCVLLDTRLPEIRAATEKRIAARRVAVLDDLVNAPVIPPVVDAINLRGQGENQIASNILNRTVQNGHRRDATYAEIDAESGDGGPPTQRVRRNNQGPAND